MAINFPASPNLNDTFVSGGVTYTWDGTVWVASGPAAFVQKSGDTMTGDLTVPSLNGGPLAGFRNILINGDLTINQRGVDVTAVSVGEYGQDRWKKTVAGANPLMTQIIEEGNYVPNAEYTLSGINIVTQQLIAPSNGDWTLIDVRCDARKIQLEIGPVATPFEHRHGELALCQRYYQKIGFNTNASLCMGFATQVAVYGTLTFVNEMRVAPSVISTDPSYYSVTTTGVSQVCNGFAVDGSSKTSARVRFIHPSNAGFLDKGAALAFLTDGRGGLIFDAEL